MFAVHIAAGVLSPPWLAGGFAVAAGLVALAVYRIREPDIVRVGLFTAAFFVASQIHVPAGVASVHLMLNGVFGVVLRRFAPLAVAEGLVLQALLFGHGGLDALGVNCCVLGVPALLAGYAYPPLRAAVGRYPFARGFVLGLAASCLTVLLNAAVLLLGGREDWPTLVKLVVVAHAPVVVVEALLTGVVVAYLEKVKPEWLAPPADDHSPSGNISSNGTSH